jgi:hypothetical protein
VTVETVVTVVTGDSGDSGNNHCHHIVTTLSPPHWTHLDAFDGCDGRSWMDAVEWTQLDGRS